MTRARIGLILLILLLAGGLTYGFLARPLLVELAQVSRGPLVVTVEEEGKTRVMERYLVSAPMAGYARRIDLEVGDPVTPGQVLAVLEPARSDALDPRSRAQARAQVSAARAALAAARERAGAAAAETELARQEIARAEKLGQAKFLSQSAVDQARARLSRAQAVEQAARHDVGVAGYELETATAVLGRAAAMAAGAPAETLAVRAPIRGQVLKLLHESEGALPAGQPLVEIGDPQGLEVEVEVLSTAAVQIVPGARVRLDRWGGAAPLEGVVRVVEPAGFTKISALGVEEQRVRVIVDFVSPRAQWQRLGDGYRVEAVFLVWEGSDVLQLPASALFRHDSGWAAYRVVDGRARLQPVRIGQRSGLRAQVLEGLRAGDQVIAHPDDKIADGVRVEPRQTGAGK